MAHEKNKKPDGSMEVHKYVEKLEDAIRDLEQRMELCIHDTDNTNFKRLCEGYIQAQTEWLLAAQSMSPEKARAFMVGLATGGAIAKWKEERQPGPPPNVISCFADYKLFGYSSEQP